MTYTAPKRLYVSHDGSRLIEEDDPAGGQLLVAKGLTLPDAVARRYGLLDAPASAPKPEPEPEAEVEGEAKAVSGPPENKAYRAPSPPAPAPPEPTPPRPPSEPPPVPPEPTPPRPVSAAASARRRRPGRPRKSAGA